MTKEKFDKLPDGTKVWFSPAYFAFPMLGIIRTIDGERGIWINFFGDGQCLFVPRRPQHYDYITTWEEA